MDISLNSSQSDHISSVHSSTTKPNDAIFLLSPWINYSLGVRDIVDQNDDPKCYHLTKSKGDEIVGYARISPLVQLQQTDPTSMKSLKAARVSGRLPAFELQQISFSNYAVNASLRDILIEAFRIANISQIRFLFTCCHREGTQALKNLGIRYSTLSAPFELEKQRLVVVCIPVTNSNFSTLSPLKIVGGIDASSEQTSEFSARKRCVEDPTEFDKSEALHKLFGHQTPD